MPTVDELLRTGTDRLRSAGSETPRLDAEVLLASILRLDRTRLIAYGETLVGEASRAMFEAGLDRRAAGEPVAYIRGLKEFRGLVFAVDRRSLIPRPETELLVDLAEAAVGERLVASPPPRGSHLRVADVGTGSGAVAVALAVALRRRRMLDVVRIVATDVSDDALRVAAENVASHAVADAVRLEVADLLSPGADVFDLILSNPPYVRSGAIAGLPIATSFEPRLALDGGPDGLDVVRRLLDLLPTRLGHDGLALIEIGADQDEAIRAVVAERLPGWRCTVELDIAGAPRVARIEPGA